MTPPGTAKDSIRAAMFTASPVSRSGFDDHFADMEPDANRSPVCGELPLDRDCGSTAASELGNLLMLPSPSRCTIVPSNAS